MGQSTTSTTEQRIERFLDRKEEQYPELQYIELWDEFDRSYVRPTKNKFRRQHSV